jgi:hypothetical protein
MILGVLVLLGVAVAAVPAQAVNSTACGGEFLIFAKDDIIFENGLTLITGNVFVQSPTGKVKVGSNNIIHGTISANRIILGTGAVVDNCVANIIEGPGTCTASTIGFAPSVACKAVFPPLPLVAPVIPVCVNTAAAVTIAVDGTLPAGCYGNLKVNKGVTLTLDQGGTYNFKSVSNGIDSTIQTLGASATLNVKGDFVSSERGTLKNLNLNIASTGGHAFFFHNDSLLENVVANVPFGNTHPHTGSQLRGTTELVSAVFHDIQPITNEPGPQTQVCICPAGTVFETGPGVKPDRVCVPNAE